jgi:hypothetical protein
MTHIKDFLELSTLRTVAGLAFGGGQAPPEEFANSRRPARHSMPKSEVLNGLEFLQGELDL